MREYFSRVLGNGDTKLRLGKAIENGTLSHAFLFSGPDGSGKLTLAIELAAAVNCENLGNPSKPLPCGECNNCRRIREGKFPDITVAARKKDKATFGVDTVKDLREDMFLSATEAERKVYILDEAEYMTDEAQNALLKVLEEPPRGVMIILLTTECDKILTTIKSRAQLISMCRFEREELAEFLGRLSPDAASLSRREPEKFNEIIVGAMGRLGEAMRLLDPKLAEQLRTERDEARKFIASLSPRSGFSEVHNAIADINTPKRRDLLDSLERIIAALGDLIAISRGRVHLSFYTSESEAKQKSDEIGLMRLLAAYDAVIEAHDYCTRNGNIGNLLTNLELRLGNAK